MQVSAYCLSLLVAIQLGLASIVHADAEGDIVISRDVPARSAIRPGDRSPAASQVQASQSTLIISSTAQATALIEQSGDQILAATCGSVMNPAQLLVSAVNGGQTSIGDTPLVLTSSSSPGGLAGGGTINHVLQPALAPLSVLPR